MAGDPLNESETPDGRRTATPPWEVSHSLEQQSQAIFVAPTPALPGYQIDSRIGGGGMGDVFRGVQQGTGRPVAIKIMRRDFTDERFIQRFDREVKLTALLDHPNIARVYDSGLHDGVYYYSMQLIDGAPLDDYIKTHQLSRNETLELMRAVARAVQHAHQRGVIHRDLKPNNI